MILLVTMITSSAVVANSLIARYTACRSALYTNQCQVKQLLSRVKYIVTYILVLEELRSAKEQRSGLLGIECFADIEKVYDPSEKSSTFPRAYGGFIEDAGLLNYCGLVVVIRAEAALLVLFRSERHDGSREDERAVQHDVEESTLQMTFTGAHTSSSLTAPRGHGTAHVYDSWHPVSNERRPYRRKRGARSNVL